jgi:hypothetical protein
MTDHWGDFDFDDHHDVPDDHLDIAEIHHDLPDLPEIEHHDEILPHDLDTPEIPDLSEPAITAVETTDLFPPTLDVGDLPEPVDGFPWIDTTTLGSAASVFETLEDPVTPDELAAYAHTGQPADWAALTESEDPATAALARWWTPDEQ